MPYINLIAEQRLAKRQEGAKARTGLIAFACATSLSVIACGFLFIESESLDGDIARLHSDAKKSEPLKKEIELVQASMADMGPKLKSLESAAETTTKWLTVLDHLTVQTPRDLWLTSIRCAASDPTKPIEVNYQGIAPRLDTVGEFILRLQNCKDLEQVSLKYTQEKSLANGLGIEFDVTSQLVGTAEETVKEESTESGGDKK